MKRPWQITNEEEWLRDCRQVVHVSQSILEGTIDLTEGARRLAALCVRVRAEDDEDFLVFVGIASETDRFPLGEVREQWNSHALARYDTERRRVESHFQQSAEVACRNLIQKYENAT